MVPQGIAPDKEPGREVREEAGIFEPLDTRDGRRDGLVHNEVVVHVRVAGGLAGGMNDSAHHVEPIGRRQKMGLNVPVASDDPRPFEELKCETKTELHRAVVMSYMMSRFLMKYHIRS